jgi:hypothetical protein
MALTRSAFPRLTSGFFMFTPSNAVFHFTMAEAWFRPLAFALVYYDWGLGAALVDAQGWAVDHFCEIRSSYGRSWVFKMSGPGR